MHKSLVSIIVPAFNAAANIEECLMSLVHQTWSSLEVIVVDDGSQDGTSVIVRKLAEKYPVISLYIKENGGVSSARNLGISVAKGSYIALQDADDTSSPYRIEKQVKYLNKNRLALCGCGLSIFGCKSREKLFPENDAELKGNFLFFKKTVAGPSILFRKEAIGGIKFNESIAYGEDYDFILRVAFSGKNKIGNIREPLYSYRKHDCQTTGRLEHTNRTNMIRIIYSFLYESGVDVTEIAVKQHFDLCKMIRKATAVPESRFYSDVINLIEDKGGKVKYQRDRLYSILKFSSKRDRRMKLSYAKDFKKYLSVLDRLKLTASIF